MDVVSLPKDHEARVAALQMDFQTSYDATHELTDPSRRKIAEQLLARIGTVDWQGENYSSPEKQRDLSIKFHWGHSHRFAEDLSIQGRMKDRHIRLISEFFAGFELDTGHLKGKSVLDIGCWTGGTTLMLKMLGAGHVQAVEEVRKYAEVAQILTRDVYGHDDVTCIPQSLYQLPEGQFDHVYIPGVVYHLSDPVLALRILFNQLRDGGDILIESAGIEHDEPMCWFKGNGRHFGGEKKAMSRGGWAWFWPSASCLGAWLEEAGFEDVRVFWSPLHKRVYGHARRNGFRDITRAGLAIPDIT